MEKYNVLPETNAYRRLQMLFGKENFIELEPFVESNNGYAEVRTAFGYINNIPVYAFSQDMQRNSGAISTFQCSKICKLYDLAAKTGFPIVGIYDSLGANLSEGINMLNSYSELLFNVNRLSGVVLQISIVVGNCFGASSLIASSADFLIMTDNAYLGIDTSGENSSSEFVKNSGISHINVTNCEEAINSAIKLISILPSNNLSQTPLEELKSSYDIDIKKGDKFSKADTIISIFDDSEFFEIQMDYGYAAKIGFARFEGRSVGVIISIKELLDKQSCDKITRFVRFCDAFSIPLITFIDSNEFESLKEAAKVANVYSDATNVKITIITGEVYGTLYIALAGKGTNSDVTYAWEEAFISSLKPETEAEIVCSDELKSMKEPFKDRKKIVSGYKKSHLSAVNAAKLGFIDDIISIEDTRIKICYSLEMLSQKRMNRIPRKHSNIQI